jgi:hypothetical protein
MSNEPQTEPVRLIKCGRVFGDTSEHVLVILRQRCRLAEVTGVEAQRVGAHMGMGRDGAI